MDENELLEKGYKKYTGNEIDVYFKKDLCIHSARCVRGNRQVFNVNKKPWIFPDGEPDVNKLTKIIDTCPNGALKYIKK